MSLFTKIVVVLEYKDVNPVFLSERAPTMSFGQIGAGVHAAEDWISIFRTEMSKDAAAKQIL